MITVAGIDRRPIWNGDQPSNHRDGQNDRPGNRSSTTTTTTVAVLDTPPEVLTVAGVGRRPSGIDNNPPTNEMHRLTDRAIVLLRQLLLQWRYKTLLLSDNRCLIR